MSARLAVRAATRSSPSGTSEVRSLASVVLAAWAGSLWTVCGLVAPLLFVVLEDRSVAGDAAAALFAAVSWLGAALGAAFLLISRTIGEPTDRRGDRLLALGAMLPPVLVQLAVEPAMRAARLGGDAQRFGLLHGLSAMLFAFACLAALVLVWRFSRRAG